MGLNYKKLDKDLFSPYVIVLYGHSPADVHLSVIIDLSNSCIEHPKVYALTELEDGRIFLEHREWVSVICATDSLKRRYPSMQFEKPRNIKCVELKRCKPDSFPPVQVLARKLFDYAELSEAFCSYFD